jgi:hypothetical protein
MKTRIITALAFSLSLGTAAIAQTTMDTETEFNVGAGIPMEWEGEIGEAFFEDEELGILRTESDIRANFDELTIEQQAMVRAHCAQVEMAAADFDADLDAGAAEVTQYLDLDDELDETTADLDVERDIETGAAAPGTTPELDDEFDTGAADVDTDIETGATTPGVDGEFETEAELTQDLDQMPGDGTMDAQIEASIEQLCAWIDE